MGRRRLIPCRFGAASEWKAWIAADPFRETCYTEGEHIPPRAVRQAVFQPAEPSVAEACANGGRNDRLTIDFRPSMRPIILCQIHF
jgi:hypothetical protein